MNLIVKCYQEMDNLKPTHPDKYKQKDTYQQ